MVTFWRIKAYIALLFNDIRFFKLHFLRYTYYDVNYLHTFYILRWSELVRSDYEGKNFNNNTVCFEFWS